ncbi:HNH endonuclease signature motif containing protein [Microbacterium ulmi]|uniref:DUF222 domain-containing protein n=1 Tax=Microbacterium ulmi TaxID=179095 RepID=A0A7Y2M1I1_9MICO|nr:HNH endonuclease signature motif containing protein [Microbacterium ulmi]NII68621.1 hypothetical protein [Microbacterium ulmi]NNH04791.1 DUF222 domain-containing protein [Microbacterium ulmi]
MSRNTIAAAERADARMEELLPKLIGTRREMARLQAEEARLLAEARRIADDWADDEEPASTTSTAEFPHRSIAAEIATAWRVSDRTIQRQIDDAAALVHDYPGTLGALTAGDISAAHARIIVAAGAVVERAELRAEYEASVLEYALCESATRLAPIAKRRAEWFAESAFEQRHRRARAERRVWVVDVDDGMAEIHALVPAVIAHGIHDRLTTIGRTIAAGRTAGPGSSERPTADRFVSAGDDGAPDAAAIDTRTLDELRADILSDLLLATDPVAHGNGPTGLGAIHATVQVTVPVLTLIDDRVTDPFEIAMLDGHSPVDPETARMLTAGAPGWDRVLTHPISGAVLAVDRYRPSDELRRHLRVRDEHCRFPGCRLAARRCDADHTVDHALGGATRAENLAHLCRRHHTLKHQTAWTVEQRSGGILEWTSPTGRMYTDIPVSSVAFAPDPECELAAAPF